MISEEALLENVESLVYAPKKSTIRVNTLKINTEKSLREAKSLLSEGKDEFLVNAHPEFPDLLLVDSLGPFTVTPKERRVIVSLECAQAVFRGAPVFAPGVLAIEIIILLLWVVTMIVRGGMRSWYPSG